MGMTKMGQAAIFETRGNHDCHVILRRQAPQLQRRRRAPTRELLQSPAT